MKPRRKPNISVIVPYHNEGQAVLRTLKRLVVQTLPPAEILMVDSSSTDDGPALLEKWLRGRKACRSEIRSIRLGTTTPSSSKNLGILLAKYPWLAFMDCGHVFNRRWLEQQWKEAGPKIGIVYGRCCFTGRGPFDSCAVAQTYGYGRHMETVPGSLIRKSVFQRVGLFHENRRAGYDVAWRKRSQGMGVPHRMPSLPNIRYESFQMAKDSKALFLKSFSYARATLGLGSSGFVPKYLLLLALTLLVLFLIPSWWPVVLALYVSGRGYLWPALRSSHLARLLSHYPSSLVLLPCCGFLCDLGRLAGIFAGAIGGTTMEHAFRFSDDQESLSDAK